MPAIKNTPTREWDLFPHPLIYRTFRTDPRYAQAVAALAITGLPREDVKIAEYPSPTATSGTLGEYKMATDELWTRRNSTEIFAAVHEYGHVIWYHADHHVALMIAYVLKAVRKTPEIRHLVKEQDRLWDYGQYSPRADYLLDSGEAWARAVAQYVSTFPGQDPNFTQGWYDQLRLENRREMQWSDDSFIPVRHAFDEAFPRQTTTTVDNQPRIWTP